MDLFSRECRFATAASSPETLPPPERGEIAFAGRSNVGKSSLINALVRRNGLARASNTPGRTQQINFFDLGGVLMLADLPGYGYARASKEKVHSWNQMVRGYLRGRPTLRRVCLLVDSRHGFKDSDLETMDMLDASGVPYVVVLTKGDKPKAAELAETIQAVEAALRGRIQAHPQAFLTSSDKKTGLDELRAFLTKEARL